MSDRDEFETWLKDTYRHTDYSTERDGYGHYFNAVWQRRGETTYADVQMLWETWKAARLDADAEIERLRGDVEEQSRLRDHFGEQARYWQAEYERERQRARMPEELAARLRAAHDDPDGRCNRQWRILSCDLLAWHEQQEGRSDE